MTAPFFLFLLFTSPAYVLPLILGPVILRSFRGDPLTRFAGYLTMKPLVATPVWLLFLIICSELNYPDRLLPILTLLPAIGLTAIIVRKFRQVFQSDRRMAFVLLACDAVRWINTLIWVSLNGNISRQMLFHIAGLILPNLYAIMALLILRSRVRRARTAMPA